LYKEDKTKNRQLRDLQVKNFLKVKNEQNTSKKHENRHLDPLNNSLSRQELQSQLSNLQK